MPTRSRFMCPSPIFTWCKNLSAQAQASDAEQDRLQKMAKAKGKGRQGRPGPGRRTAGSAGQTPDTRRFRLRPRYQLAKGIRRIVPLSGNARPDYRRRAKSRRICSRQPAMDRLLCGDVGYGKTELAMRAAFKAVEDGKQVAVLVPTTVLCVQHGRTFTERFADFPVVDRSRSTASKPHAQAVDIINAAQSGKVDILIGTHRLLSGDVKFQGPRACHNRRGAAVRRRAQGEAQKTSRQRRHPDDDRDANSANAAYVDAGSARYKLAGDSAAGPAKHRHQGLPATTMNLSARQSCAN